MPDMFTKRGQDEAGACYQGAAYGRSLTVMGPPFGKQSEEEWHREVHDAIGCCTDDTSNFTAAS